MSLRFNTLLIVLQTSIFYRKALFIILLIAWSGRLFPQNGNDNVKNQALKLFEEEDYTQAYKLYSQLVANFPKDPEYNYRLGVCMIFAEPDKTKCLPFLKFANSKPDEAPKETKFYLGKAYHINYLFDEAIRYYGEYKKVGSTALQKKLQVDREIKACGYGKRLLSNLSDLVIQSKKQLNEADYFRSYDLRDVGGKLLTKPEEFKSGVDKKKKDKSIVYLPALGNRVYFSSYGSEDNRDIYYATKLSNGTFSKPEKVKGINSDQDEDYPFLHPDGTTMYFASKGYNSMGGYDIFKSTYIESSDSWSQPVNLEFPINSPDDDYLYVTDSAEKTAYFSTGRQSLPGKIDVLKISTERKPIDLLSLKGTVVKENPGQSAKSRITVKNMDNGNIVGIFDAGDNGDYLMDLPNGAKLLYTVETPGLKTQSDKVALPMVSTSKPLRQTLSYDNGILKIINYFDEVATDESYIQYLKIIEQKAKLEENQGKNNLNTSVVNNGNATGGNDTSSVKTKTSSTTATSKTGLDNKQLSEMAAKEALELAKEGSQLTQDADDAFELGNKKKLEADNKLKEADAAFKNAELVTNEGEKKDALEKANLLKKEATDENEVAAKILGYASALKEDAAVKIKEADLNKQYSDELTKSVNNKNNSKETLDKLDNIQKQIDDISGYKKKSDEVYNSIKNDADDKEKELTNVEKNGEDLKTNIREIKESITLNENDLAKAKRKEKENIQNKINDLKADQTEKEKQYENNTAEVTKLKEELSGLNKGLDLANKVKNETIAVNTNTTAIVTNTMPAANTASEKITGKTLSDKYKDKIIITDNTNKDNIEQNTTLLKNYNDEIDAVIAKDKSELLKTANANTKQQLTNEIKQLDAAKKQNLQKIATNNKKIDELNKTLAVINSPAKNEGIKPITATSSAEAVKELDNLDTKLNSNDNANFEFNGYQNPESQKLKIEADAKINESIAKQKKLKDIIGSAKDQVKNNGEGNISESPQELSRQAEELGVKAFDLRTQANSKTGAEKDNLLAQAKVEEDKANEKNLKVADIVKNDNKSLFDTESENLKLLIADNKANETDVSEAKKLSEEAIAAYKQAVSIREEANSLPNTGARLGNLSNAEEKEAEAIAKQQQAVDLLKTSSPDLALKKAVTSASISNNSPAGGNNLNDQLSAVNNGVNELLSSKLSAYEKLYDANQLELEAASGELKNNQATIDKTPALKSEFISAGNKINSAQNLKQSSGASSDNNKKISDLVEGTKKQVEALNQLNALNKKVNASIAKNNGGNNNANNITTVKTNTATVDNNNAATTNTLSNVNSNGNNNAVAINTVSNAGNNNPVATNTVINSNDNSNVGVITNTVDNSNNNTAVATNSANNAGTPAGTLNVASLRSKDTSAAQVVALFETKKVTLKNQQANTMINNALSELKNIENENKALANEISNSGRGGNGPENAAQIKSKSDNLLLEAEDLGVKAFDLKTLANTLSGSQKDSLLVKAKELEDESQIKKLASVKLTEQGNQLSYSSNNAAINELLEKLKNEDPDLATQLNEKTNEVASLKTKSNQLREEANAQSNNNARIGSMMNAEEKEAEMLQKQDEILAELKKRYPDYVVKQQSSPGNAGEIPSDLKQKRDQLSQKQFEQLTNLTNAFSLEYETSKNNIPLNLNNNQKTVKQNADDLNAESKRLLIQSAGEKNNAEKEKLLTLAAKSANMAVDLLNTLPKTNNAIASNNTNTNNNNANANNTNLRNNTGNNNPRNNGNTNVNAGTNARNNVNNNAITNNAANNTAGRGTVKVDGLEVTAGNAYTNAKPIPVDAKAPDGLVFRVQIGAFKVKLPDNSFKGLSPLNAETSPSGYIRYTAGNFNKLENANAVKNDLKNLGYSDAFVVGFYNGKRVSLNEALEILAREGKTVDNNAPQTAGITANANVPRATTNPTNPDINIQDAAVITKELEQINGLLYTVQIGVYNKQVNKGRLFNLNPIYSEKLPNGLFRYTAGIYNNTEKLIADKGKVVGLGIRDAFVSAYFNGKRVTIAEGKTKQQDSTTKMEPENPIIFPNPNAASNTLPLNNVPVANTTVQPFSNGVTAYPAATAENGIKPAEDGISFKVQIGAYSKQVPNDVAAKFSSIKTWPVENKQINALFIYNIGNFSEAKFAKTLKDEAVKAGINDAYITVYKDGKKIGGTEAAQYLNR